MHFHASEVSLMLISGNVCSKKSVIESALPQENRSKSAKIVRVEHKRQLT